MSLKTRIGCFSVLIICYVIPSSEAGWAKPETPVVVDDGNEIDIDTSVKKCEMTCHTVRSQVGSGNWKEESFTTIISGIYTCRMQDLGRMLRSRQSFADIAISSLDVSANRSISYFAHMAILSLTSETLEKGAAEAVRAHISLPNRDRERLPTYRWPPLPQQAVNAILDYIYTHRIRNFDEIENTVAVYVGAFFLDIPELRDAIEKYLRRDSYDVLRQLYQLVAYIRWAHDMEIIELKLKLVEMARRVMDLDEAQFDKFIRDICEPNGYYKTTGRLPLPGGSAIPFGRANVLDEFIDRFNRTSATRGPYDNSLKA